MDQDPGFDLRPRGGQPVLPVPWRAWKRCSRVPRSGASKRVSASTGEPSTSRSPVNLRPGQPGAGMGVIRRVAADAEQAEIGFWPGSERYPKPAFYAFTYPSPAGVRGRPHRSRGCVMERGDGRFPPRLRRRTGCGRPRSYDLAFAESTYAAGAQAIGLDPHSWSGDRRTSDRPVA